MDGAGDSTMGKEAEMEAKDEPWPENTDVDTSLIDRRTILLSGVVFAAVVGGYVATGTTPFVVGAGAILAGVTADIVHGEDGGATVEAALGPLVGLVVALSALMSLAVLGVLPTAMGDRTSRIALLVAFASPIFALLSAAGNWAFRELTAG